MTLRAKLLLAQGPLLSALVLVGALAVIGVNRLGTKSAAILKDNYRSVLAAQRMKESIERMDSGAAFAVAGQRERGLAQAAANQALFEAELQVQEHNITEPREKEATEGLRAEWTRYLSLFDAFRKADDAALRNSFFAELEPAFGKTKDAADEILGINQDAMIRKSNLTSKEGRQISTLLVAAAVAATALGFLFSSSLTTAIVRPVSVLTQTVQRIGAGDLEVRALVESKDEIGHLAGEFNALAASLAAYRKSTLGDLIQAQQSSQATIDSLPDPVVVFGAGGLLLSVNRAAETMLGISSEGADPLARVPSAARTLLENARAHVLSGKGPLSPGGYESAVRVSTPEGVAFLLARANPIYADMGVAGVAVVLQDVSRLRRLDELTSDLVATVAHEFRTPLTSLRMAIHLCLEETVGPLTPKQADMLAAAREDCERLQTIVDELLDVSRIRSGTVVLGRRAVSALSLVQEAVAAGQDAAASDSRGVSIESQGAPDAFVSADEERVKLVFSNLITNAIRYVPDNGHIVLRALEKPDAIRFEVEDDGPGVPEEWRDRIFDKFVQVPGRAGGGSGLGLHIAREIVVAHGGQIGVEPREGGGSIFWFTVPRETSTPASLPQPGSAGKTPA